MKSSLGVIALVCISLTQLKATSAYNYAPGEYVSIVNGVSPDGKYAITMHGDGEGGFDNLHVYLTDATSGRKIGPLEELNPVIFDASPDSYLAVWSPDSSKVSIICRIDRHSLGSTTYLIGDHRAKCIAKPSTASSTESTAYNTCPHGILKTFKSTSAPNITTSTSPERHKYWIIGKWLDSRKYNYFNEDGSWGIQRNEESPIDSNGRSWKIEGNILTLMAPNGSFTYSIVSCTQDELIVSSDGHNIIFKRQDGEKVPPGYNQ